MDDNDQMPINLPVKAQKFVDRRKRPNWIVRIVSTVAILGWISAFIALLLIDRASPAQENFITRILNVNVASYWNSSLLRGAFIATLISVIACVLGIILNVAFHRRKTDRYSKMLIIITVASIVLLVFYLVNFATYL